MPDRLAQQIRFIIEIDKLKHVLRRTLTPNLATTERRLENSAEHSWHIAMMVLLLAEHADVPIDPLRVIKMLLVHDLVEIDAGDTYIYDTAGAATKAAREHAAAERIFGLLPLDQGADLRAAWEEYEARQSPSARFAYALDRLQPVLLNYLTQGEAWRKHNVTSDRVLAVNSPIQHGSKALWHHARNLINDAVARGYLDK